VSELVTTNNIYYGVGYYPGYRQPSIDINKNGKARISYIDASGNLIYRERKSDGTWTSETIDSGIGNQKGSFIKVNRTNQVHIAQHKKHYYEYELPVAGNPEICGDGEDNDGNGFIDYRDPACTGSCILPNVIKNETGGTGAGAPWVPSVYNSSYAGCCLTSQCYYYVDSGDNGCVNADTGISKLVAGNLVNIYCEVNGTSAVWCKEGYANNGTGGCVLTTIEPICGDGNVDLGEECDDEDTDNGDGCSSICEKEDGWDCISEPSLCEYVGLEIRRTCNDITDQETCISYEDPSQLTDSMKQGIQEKSLISNNFCFDAIYTFEPDTFNGGIEGDANTCGTYIACSCYWNSATTSCEERTFRESTNPGLCTSTVIPLSTCIIDTDDSLYGSCIDGEDEYLINWTADWNGLGENTIEGCVSGEKMLPCPKSTNINFFNIINLIIAILIIIVIYLIISNRKKKSKNDGKTRKRGKK
ncbi:MAG TPA: hypothetical protein VI815_03285, partial [Candidatus Nanoarchaeia archaeon]|nr:hypothetical protein [Candidatus Nanoarchaeia archaeon]